MIRLLQILCFVLAGCMSLAQRPDAEAGPSDWGKKISYYYSAASERYFSDREIDSIFYFSAKELFDYNGIPANVFESKYQTMKPQLVSATRVDIGQAFRWVESTGEATIKAPKGSEAFTRNKELYIKNLVKCINKAFVNNRNLRRYFGFNGSDRITFFNSTVRVQKNGKLLVTEEISIYNGDGTSGSDEPGGGEINNEIKRGIVRAFPLYYVNEKKLFQNTTFKVKKVLRDGMPEDYHTEKKDNGILLFTGNKYRFLDKGFYKYSITYETDHQLKLLKDYDELFWNVTGSGWNFRMDSVRCTIIVPSSKIVSNACYTGEEGSKASDCDFTLYTEGDSTHIIFRSAQSLLPRHGLSVASSWPKGIVSTPTAWQDAKYMVWNNKAVFFLPLAALFSAIFCFIYWLKYGRDIAKGSIYPEYQPPVGFSPAAIGYIRDQRFDKRFTAATIVDAAVRNIVGIGVERGGWVFKHNVYTIRMPDKKQKPPVSTYEDFKSEVKDLVGTSIEKGKYNSALADLNKKVESHCDSNYRNKDGKKAIKTKGYFSLNTSFTSIPILVCIAAALWGFFGGIYPIVSARNFTQLGYFAAGIFLCWLVLKIFSRLLPAYNAEGRKLMDHIEGFRMFLATADVQRFDAMAPPEKTLELYEKYLPFAIALDCEVEWGKQFESILEAARLDPGTATMSSFTSHMSHDSDSISSSFASSFSGAITSASSPPSSSSGGGSSFGGGSSGGGGGGGGGGGW